MRSWEVQKGGRRGGGDYSMMDPLGLVEMKDGVRDAPRGCRMQISSGDDSCLDYLPSFLTPVRPIKQEENGDEVMRWCLRSRVFPQETSSRSVTLTLGG